MSRRLILGLAFAALLAAALAARFLMSGPDAHAKEPSAGPPPVRVVLAAVEKKDVPVWLDGLGAVAAWQQVLVKPQVDGRLESVVFHEGQSVKKGDLLAQIDPRPFLVQLHLAQGNLAKDQATARGGKINLDRYQKLVEQKMIAAQQLDDQQAIVGQAEGAIQADQAAVESARLNLDYAAVKAPCDGVVGVRLVDAGNQVHASDATGLVVITQLDPAAVIVTLPQDQLEQVATALAKGDVPVEVWSRDGARKLGVGTLYALDNQIATATGTVKVKARVPNEGRKLWPNQFVKARLLVDTLPGALAVPTAAIQRGPQGSFVYVAGADQTVAQRPVIVIMPSGDQSVVTGVQAGEQVVVEGQSQLRPGAKIATGDTKPAAPGENKPAAPNDKKPAAKP
jgi:multidrug efflux system membrane fusion protein